MRSASRTSPRCSPVRSSNASKPTHRRDPTAPGVVVAAIASVDDASTLTAEVRAALSRFRAAGIRKTWIFRAFDDGHEVLILQEFADENQSARGGSSIPMRRRGG